MENKPNVQKVERKPIGREDVERLLWVLCYGALIEVAIIVTLTVIAVLLRGLGLF